MRDDSLPIDLGAPLSVHRAHPGSRLKLVCGACAWSRSYRPEAIVAALRAKKLGDAETAIAAVAKLVQWPCPACRRMRWGSLLVADGIA